MRILLAVASIVVVANAICPDPDASYNLMRECQEEMVAKHTRLDVFQILANCINTKFGDCARTDQRFSYEFMIYDHAVNVVRQANGSIPNQGKEVRGSIFRDEDYYTHNADNYFPSECPQDDIIALGYELYCSSLDFEHARNVCVTKHQVQYCLMRAFQSCEADDFERLFGDRYWLSNNLAMFGKCEIV